jgi:glutathione S-transferase
VKLYVFEGSCAALTTRLELDFKGLDYETVYLPPVLHGFILGVRGFPRPSVPGLELDGRRISGTREISRALDELRPEPPLFPADPARRAAVEEAEQWGEDFQDAARRILYCVARREPSAWRTMMSRGQRAPVRILLRAAAPLLVRFAARYHGGADERCRRDLLELPQRLDRIDRWIAEGVLAAEAPTAADFEIATNVRFLLEVEDVAPSVEGRPAADHSRRLVPDFPGRFPPVLPPEWLSR